MTHVMVALVALLAGYGLPLWAFPYACLSLIVLLAAMAWANGLEAS